MSDWKRVDDELPESGRAVLVAVKNTHGNRRVLRAFYAAKYMVESTGEWDAFADYHEERDTYYTPEGWYENNEYEETNWNISDVVTHWMPLPLHPGSAKP